MQAKFKVAYITDVEGRWDKLADFARDNPLVSLDAAGLRVAPGAVFVFGGDAVDRGPHAMRIVRTLLEAKQRQPEQVILLAGNRDINKLRLARELRGLHPYPLPDEVRAGGKDVLMRWIFKNTMNAPQAFEHRLAELRALGRDAQPLDVPESLLADVLPGGVFAEYLRHAQLAYRHGATLFVHGGVTEESLGFVPNAPSRFGDPDQWIAALNAFYAAQLANYFDHALEAPEHKGWSDLIRYQAPVLYTRRNQASVIYGRTADDAGNPYLPDAATMRALTAHGIHRVVVGHTPAGDAPNVLRASDFELVFADTSYSPLEHGTRVLIADHALDVRGRLRIAGANDVDVAFTLGLADASSPIGQREVRTGALVKAIAPDGRYVLGRFGDGYAVEQHLVDRLSELEVPLRPLVQAAEPSAPDKT